MANSGFFLSPQQQFLFTHAAGARTQVACLIQGHFDADRLHAALDRVVTRHEALRTLFQRQTGMKLPFQVVQDSLPPVWTSDPVAEAGPDDFNSAIVTRMAAEAQAAFSPDGSPLRSALVHSAGQTLWILTALAAVADVASIQMLLEQVVKSYAGIEDAAAEDSLRYVQFAQWQSDQLEADDEAAQEARTFWAAAVQDAVAPTFPGAQTGPGSAADVPPLTRLPLTIEGDPAAFAVATGEEIAASDVLLAAWNIVLSRWTAQPRVALGVVAEGREYVELAGLVGAVAKQIPAGLTVQLQKSFRDAVLAVHEQFEEAASVQEYYAPAQPFQAGFTYASLSSAIEVAGTIFTPVAVHSSAHQGTLQLAVQASPGNLRTQLVYSPQSLSQGLAESLASSFETFFSAALTSPSEPIGRLPLVSSSVREELLSFGSGASEPVPSEPIDVLIRAQAERTPEAEAVRCGEDAILYRELEARSNQLAHHLQTLGVGRGSLVGLSVARTAAMMVPVLAILKAGAAYVSLAADQPKARLTRQMEGLAALVTESSLAGQMDGFSGPLVVLETAGWQAQPSTPPHPGATAEDLAYVIYTSGSTGTPKGVGIRHRNLTNYALDIVRKLDLATEPLQFGTVSTLSADLGNTAIYPALLTGGCLHVLPYEVAADPRAMLAYQQAHPLDVLKIVPSHLEALLDGAGPGILPRRILITGGEALKPALAERAATSGTCTLVNHYGPTETTVGSLMLRIQPSDWQRGLATLPIGRPLANTQAYVLDSHGALVPVGVTGELYLGGAGVSAGYLGQPTMTAERFLPSFHHPETSLMYRTGDLARWLPDGVLEFLGRADDQVKIRGFRVEPGEIEAALAAQPGVRQAVVLARNLATDPQLVAYVVLDRQQPVTTITLRDRMKSLLPDYMVPAAIVELPRLPLTPNGKLDRNALPAPEARSTRTFRAPATPTEELVAQIWTTVLKIPAISTDENFFDLGGHSLLATQVISRVREALQVEVPLRTMFEAPVLSEFAAAVDRTKASAVSGATSGPIKRVARQVYRADSSNM